MCCDRCIEGRLIGREVYIAKAIPAKREVNRQAASERRTGDADLNPALKSPSPPIPAVPVAVPLAEPEEPDEEDAPLSSPH